MLAQDQLRLNEYLYLSLCDGLSEIIVGEEWERGTNFFDKILFFEKYSRAESRELKRKNG